MSSLQKRFDGFAKFSHGEQASTADAGQDVLQKLQRSNQEYEARFGHVFLICASGLNAAQMLHQLQTRLPNTPSQELLNAAVEQMKITELRLCSMAASQQPQGDGSAASTAERRAGRILQHVREPSANPAHGSPITTHMLDTSMGCPAPGVPVALHRLCAGSRMEVWDPVAVGRTNSDGRVPNLMPPSNRIPAGVYRMTFDVATYMAACKRQHPMFFASGAFYPLVHVHFQVLREQELDHFHVPLTWNPFGYSTYRGS